jgi:hypothetical protein
LILTCEKEKQLQKNLVFSAYKHIKKALPTFSKENVSNNESGSAKINQRCERIQSHQGVPAFLPERCFHQDAES